MELSQLKDLCKCGVSIQINEHRNDYETVEQYFDQPFTEQYKEEIPKDIFDEMVRTNTIVRVQCYPDTPIGFFCNFHYNVEQAVKDAISNLK